MYNVIRVLCDSQLSFASKFESARFGALKVQVKNFGTMSSPPATKPGLVCYMQFFTSTDCSTGPIRSEAANPTATNPVARVSGWDFYHGEPHTECLDIGGGHS